MTDSSEHRHRPYEQFSVQSLRITLGEEGSTEQQLKRELSQFFDSSTSVSSAYLARAEYENREVSHMLLGLTGHKIDKEEIVKLVNDTYARLYPSTEHLDIMFLSGTLLAEMAQVCEPFFVGRRMWLIWRNIWYGGNVKKRR